MIKYKIISTNEEILPDDLIALHSDCENIFGAFLWYKMLNACNYSNNGEYKQAIKLFKEVMQSLNRHGFARKHLVIYKFLGRAYSNNKEYKKAAIIYSAARQVFNDTMEFTFNHATSIYRYGLVLYKQGRTIEAIGHAEKAKEMFEEILLTDLGDTVVQQWLLAVNRKLAHWRQRVSGDIPHTTSAVSGKKRRQYIF